MTSEYDLDDYKISSLVDNMYNDFPCNMIDFKRHLQPDKALNKKITMGAEGRPIKSEYFNGSDKVAIIYFTFQEDANSGLVTDRKEELVYIKNDDTEGPRILIKHKIYDLTTVGDGVLAMEERVMGRTTIINEMKATILAILQTNNPTFTTIQCIGLVKPFWDENDQELRDFIDLGTSGFKDAVVAVDLNTTSYTWLSYLAAPGVTTKDYIIGKLTY